MRNGTFRLNLNLPATYRAIFTANHLELGEPLFRQFDEQKHIFEDRCRSFYWNEGILTGCHLSAKGQNLHEWHNLEIWPGNGALLSHLYWEFWLYSQDMEFLKNRAYPFMKGVMNAYEPLISKNDFGEYEVPLSCSPEFHENALDSWGEIPLVI